MKKNISNNSILIIGIILIIIGILSLIGNIDFFKNIASIILIIMLVLSIKDLINIILKKEINYKLITRVLSIILFFIALVFKDYSIAIVPILFSLYSLINALANLMNFVLLKINKLKGGYNNLFLGMLFLIICVVILFEPLIHFELVVNILGIYSILLGINFLLDYYENICYKKLRRIRMSLPSIIEVFIPIRELKKVNNKKINIINQKEKENINLEILVHVTEDGYGKFGHIDICYKDEVISFGNYDPKNNKLNGIFGSGVLFTVKNKKKYIKFCIEDTKKTIFVFGIKLNKTEEKQIEENIEKIKNQLKIWVPPYLEAKIENKNLEEYNDYSSRIYKELQPNFYKFKNGKYKVFFILKNNCVSVANKILGKIIKDKFKLYGILTPGTYYEYLEGQYLKNAGIVVSKKIYSKHNIKELIN